MVVFGLAHQVLVEPSFAVFVGVPVAIALSAPLVLAHRHLVVDDEEGVGETTMLSGPVLGAVVAAGLAVQLAIVLFAIRGRGVEQAPGTVPYALSVLAAAVVSGAVLWSLTQRRRPVALIAVGTGLTAVVVGALRSSEPGLAGVGVALCSILACAAAGWIADRTSATVTVKVPPPHPGWVPGAPR